MDPNRDMLNDMYRLVKENNHMLHGIRRSAFIARLVKFLIAILLLVAGWWFYFNFVAPLLSSVMSAMDQIQGTGEQAQVQFATFQETLKQLQSKLPSFLQASSSPN